MRRSSSRGEATRRWLQRRAGALRFLALVGVVSGAAQALPTRMVERTYYADAKYTREVGSEIRPGCNGSGSALIGRRTAFVVRTTELCTGGSGPAEAACYVDGVPTRCPPSICNSPLFECH